jgi:hypothetical protein
VTLDPAGLVNIPTGPLATQVWLRHCFLPSAGDPDPLWVKARQPSRWQTDEGTVYLAADEVTVWAEYCRNDHARIASADPTGGVGVNRGSFAYYADQVLNPPVQARAIFSVPVHLERVADLTTAPAQQALRVAGVDNPSLDLLADDFGPCQDIAKAGVKLGWQAVRAPSAARVGGAALAIFHSDRPPAGDWVLQQRAARPIVAVAYLTRYHTGQRPAWLGPAP